MLISCPACSARYKIPLHSFSAALALTCDSCGHHWVEKGQSTIIDLPAHSVPATIDYGQYEPEREAKRLVEAAILARAEYKAQRRHRLQRLRGWLLLAVGIILPISAAAAFPVSMVKIAPITLHAYTKMGYQVNIYGLELRKIEQQHSLVDGQRILTIKGEVRNISSEPQKMPWLRFSLQDEQETEVYQWTLDTNARSLKAGEMTIFTTRVASPPETAKNLQVRFAHANEVGP